MSIRLEIPDSIAQAIHLPEQRIPQELLVELALTLYSQNLLSFGKARQLARLGKYEFGRLLGERGIARHYTRAELEDDVTYAGREVYVTARKSGVSKNRPRKSASRG